MELLIHRTGQISGNYAVLKKPISKGYTLYDSTYIIFFKWPHDRDGKEMSDYQGLGRGERGRWLCLGESNVRTEFGKNPNLHLP